MGAKARILPHHHHLCVIAHANLGDVREVASKRGHHRLQDREGLGVEVVRLHQLHPHEIRRVILSSIGRPKTFFFDIDYIILYSIISYYTILYLWLDTRLKVEKVVGVSGPSAGHHLRASTKRKRETAPELLAGDYSSGVMGVNLPTL